MEKQISNKHQITKHYTYTRRNRETLIQNVIGDGKIVDEFIVDKGHPKGKERHCITSTGLILVYNLESGDLVTKLIARPAQIKRYYTKACKLFPKKLEYILDLAYWHCGLGYNN